MRQVTNSGTVPGITAGDVVKYMTLPRILPRMKTLFGTGFAHFAFFMALVYRGVRLLPQGHPYTLGVNIGRFGTINVIAEASNHLVFKRENIDQIIIYFSIIAAMILLALQLFSLGVTMFFPQALAGVSFTTANPQQDIAFMLLDRVFGVPNLFNSCVTTNSCLQLDPNQNNGGAVVLPSTSFPWPFHKALHALFQFYSVALLVVGVIILLYYAFAIVAETAQTGTPFGKRFNSLWAPIRIVVAFGLLIPIGTGLNAAQYIVLYAAKMGSGMATNGWLEFNNTLNSTYFSGDEMVAKPTSPRIEQMVQFAVLAKMCQIQRQIWERPPNGRLPNAPATYTNKPYLVQNVSASNPTLFSPMPADANSAYGFYGGNYTATIEITVGQEGFPEDKGSIKPNCGLLSIPPTIGQGNHPGAIYIRDQYYKLAYDMLNNDQDIFTLAQCFVENKNPAVPALPVGGTTYSPSYVVCDANTANYNGKIIALINKYKTQLDNIIQQAVAQERAVNQTLPPDLLARGWGGAGIFYNRIAEMNGAILGAAWSLPTPTKMPLTMELVYIKRKQNDQNMDPRDQYSPQVAAGSQAITLKEGLPEIANATAYSEAYKIMLDNASDTSGAGQKKTGNAFIDLINAIFGTEALFQMRDPDNQRVHPLAQLSALGKGMIDATIRNVGVGLAVGVGAVALGNGTLAALSSFAFTIAGILLSAGFTLYYIVPFLPFIYFFFAVGAWVKTIFEAMVGAPLWALAHIRIDGDGLPGQAALSGYYLIFEIFLRPLLTVFGMLASILVFSAMVAVLNDVFDLVIANLSGRSQDTGLVATIRGPIDQLFFTILYAIIVYMIGTSSFKLIDQVPQSVLRWMGSQVSAFGDQSGEQAVGQLAGYATAGSQIVGGQLTGSLGSMIRAGASRGR